MLRLIAYLVGVIALAVGLSWLADRPGTMVVSWQGYDVETSVFRAVVMLALLMGLTVLLWSVGRQIWRSPAAVGRFFTRRRETRGLEALSSGIIAIGTGDKALATRFAVQARKALPNEPLTHLLRAQAAELSGDRATSRRIFEAMLGSPDTEQLGLRGLFLEAQREGEWEAARQFAERAVALNPKLTWPVEALFDLQCKASDWPAALETLTLGRRNGHFDKAVADRRRAVLLTAQAQAIEDENGNKALELASEAHGLAPDLIPAAAIAGRQHASRGATAKAAKIIERTWRSAPHPELAVVYAFARPGDSPRDRFERINRLARATPHSVEGPIALATAAIDVRDWPEARKALAPLLDGNLSQRVCTLMAQIESGERNNTGGVREWLARAVNAPRDPAWTADGIVSDVWAPISPVTGQLDAFQWRVPVEAFGDAAKERALARVDEFVALGAADETLIEQAADLIDEDARVAPARAEPTRAPAAVVKPEAPIEVEPVATVAKPIIAIPVVRSTTLGRQDGTVSDIATPAASRPPQAVPIIGRSNEADDAIVAMPEHMPGKGADTKVQKAS